VRITPTNRVWLHMTMSCSESDRGGTENNGVHFAPKEDAMVIQLGVVCTGNVRVKEFLKKVDKVIYSGHTHFQFNTIYSCKVRVMLVQTTVK
jgi:hypothetical protein